jgi:hypothetical protein
MIVDIDAKQHGSESSLPEANLGCRPQPIGNNAGQSVSGCQCPLAGKVSVVKSSSRYLVEPHGAIPTGREPYLD